METFAKKLSDKVTCKNVDDFKLDYTVDPVRVFLDTETIEVRLADGTTKVVRVLKGD